MDNKTHRVGKVWSPGRSARPDELCHALVPQLKVIYRAPGFGAQKLEGGSGGGRVCEGHCGFGQAKETASRLRFGTDYCARPTNTLQNLSNFGMPSLPSALQPSGHEDGLARLRLSPPNDI